MLHLCDTFSLFSWHTSTDVERLCSSSADGPGEHLAPSDLLINAADATLDPDRPSLNQSTPLLFSCGLGSRYASEIPVRQSPSAEHADLREPHADILI